MKKSAALRGRKNAADIQPMKRGCHADSGQSTKATAEANAEPTIGQRDSDAETQRHSVSGIQSFKGNGDANDTHDANEKPRLFIRVRTLLEAAQIALADKSHGDPVFRFARAVRAFEMTMDKRLPAKELPGAFGYWWALAKSTLPPDTEREECLYLFLDVYDKVKIPLGANVIENAVAMLAKSQIPPEAARYESPKIRRLIHLCWSLQAICGNSPFGLSTRDAARVADCKSFDTANAYLKGLVRDGILALVEPGKQGKPGTGRAARFKYVTGKAPG